MSELRTARYSMNAAVRDALESRDIYDPGAFEFTDGEMLPVDLVMPTVDELLEVGDERMTSGGWSGARPWAPWEVIL